MEESVYRGSLSFEAGLIGVVCPFDREATWDESVWRNSLVV